MPSKDPGDDAFIAGATPMDYGFLSAGIAPDTGLSTIPSGFSVSFPIGSPFASSIQGPSLSVVFSTVTAAMTPTILYVPDGQGPATSGTAIGLIPLPTSQYRPAAGIFSVGVPMDWVDRAGETRVEISLVRMTVGSSGLHGEDRSSNPGSATRDSALLDSGNDSISAFGVVSARTLSEDHRHLPRWSRRSAMAESDLPWSEVGMAYRSLLGWPESLATDGPMSGVPWASAASLPPIDCYERVKMIVQACAGMTRRAMRTIWSREAVGARRSSWA